MKFINTWNKFLFQNKYAVILPIKMTQFAVPELKGSNLLGIEQVEGHKQKSRTKPISHLKSKVTFTIMNDPVDLPTNNMPMEFMPYMKYVN